jgi:hypothetical protein
MGWTSEESFNSLQEQEFFSFSKQMKNGSATSPLFNEYQRLFPHW